MTVFRYDGSFEGFLSVIHTSYYARTIPQKLLRPDEAPGLFDEVSQVATDTDKAHTVLDALFQKVGHRAVRRLFVAHKAMHPEAPLACLHYVRLGFSHPEALGDVGMWCVKSVEGLHKTVGGEAHRMLGFVRFKELEDGTWYAPFAPEHDVLELMTGHFVKRFGKAAFILHDTARNRAFIHRDGHGETVTVHAAQTPILSSDETRYQSLWQNFFDTVAVTSRLNPALQRQFVPLKYRDWMTEFQASSVGEGAP